MNVVVDGVEREVDTRTQTWGELLALLDAECAQRGVVVADVAFDGVSDQSFRDRSAATRRVRSHRIEIGTATQAALLLTAIDEAVGAAGPMRPAALALADAFRRYDIARGNADLAVFAPNLGALMQLAGNIVVFASQVVRGRASDEARDDLFSQLSQHVDALITAQQGGDWVQVADVLEYDVVAAIDACVERLQTVRAALADRAAA